MGKIESDDISRISSSSASASATKQLICVCVAIVVRVACCVLRVAC
jgi:hypothetical protein